MTDEVKKNADDSKCESCGSPVPPAEAITTKDKAGKETGPFCAFCQFDGKDKVTEAPKEIKKVGMGGDPGFGGPGPNMSFKSKDKPKKKDKNIPWNPDIKKPKTNNPFLSKVLMALQEDLKKFQPHVEFPLLHNKTARELEAVFQGKVGRKSAGGVAAKKIQSAAFGAANNGIRTNSEAQKRYVKTYTRDFNSGQTRGAATKGLAIVVPAKHVKGETERTSKDDTATGIHETQHSIGHEATFSQVGDKSINDVSRFATKLHQHLISKLPANHQHFLNNVLMGPIVRGYSKSHKPQEAIARLHDYAGSDVFRNHAHKAYKEFIGPSYNNNEAIHFDKMMKESHRMARESGKTIKYDRASDQFSGGEIEHKFPEQFKSNIADLQAKYSKLKDVKINKVPARTERSTDSKNKREFIEAMSPAAHRFTGPAPRKVKNPQTGKNIVTRSDDTEMTLQKAFEDRWLLEFGDKFKKMSEANSLPFEFKTSHQASQRDYIFKIGDCTVTYSTIGSLAKIKLDNKSDKGLRVAKALYYGIQRAHEPLVKSEDMAKEMYELSGKQAEKMLPFHGWITPQGEFHQMGSCDIHAWSLADHLGKDRPGEDDEAGCEAMIRQAHKKGWISTGVGGQALAEGYHKHLHNPNHPATRKLAEMVRSLHPSVKHIEIHDYNSGGYEVPRKLADKGVFKKPSAVQEFHAKSEKEEKPMKYTKDQIKKAIEQLIKDTVPSQGASRGGFNVYSKNWGSKGLGGQVLVQEKRRMQRAQRGHAGIRRPIKSWNQRRLNRQQLRLWGVEQETVGKSEAESIEILKKAQDEGKKKMAIVLSALKDHLASSPYKDTHVMVDKQVFGPKRPGEALAHEFVQGANKTQKVHSTTHDIGGATFTHISTWRPKGQTASKPAGNLKHLDAVTQPGFKKTNPADKWRDRGMPAPGADDEIHDEPKEEAKPEVKAPNRFIGHLKGADKLISRIKKDEGLEKVKVPQIPALPGMTPLGIKPKSTVSVPHKGKMVEGKVVRQDKEAPGHPATTVVDVGEEASIKVPHHNVKPIEKADLGPISGSTKDNPNPPTAGSDPRGVKLGPISGDVKKPDKKYPDRPYRQELVDSTNKKLREFNEKKKPVKKADESSTLVLSERGADILDKLYKAFGLNPTFVKKPNTAKAPNIARVAGKPRIGVGASIVRKFSAGGPPLPKVKAPTAAIKPAAPKVAKPKVAAPRAIK